MEIDNNNVVNVKSILSNADNQNIILDINKKRRDGRNPLIRATGSDVNNSEITKLLLEYADDHNFILEINEKGLNKNFPLYLSVTNKNIENVKLLINI